MIDKFNFIVYKYFYEQFMDRKTKRRFMEEKAKNGNYLSGYVEIDGVEHRIVIFPNKFKTEDKHPHYIMYSPFRNNGKKNT